MEIRLTESAAFVADEIDSGIAYYVGMCKRKQTRVAHPWRIHDWERAQMAGTSVCIYIYRNQVLSNLS